MTDIESRIAGALVAGSTLLTVQTVLMDQAHATAGTLKPTGALTQGSLGHAHERSIRRAIDDLRGRYPHTGNACTLLQSFDLVAACASSVATAAFPEPLSLSAIADTLAANLELLLTGHDEREIAFLQEQLLGATAGALRAELAADPTARRSYQEWFTQQRENPTFRTYQTYD